MCDKTTDMPEVFRLYGYSFYFYSREHEPIHIHVEGENGYAIFDLIEDEFIARELHGIKTGDLKKIIKAIEKRKDDIESSWNKYFGKANKE